MNTNIAIIGMSGRYPKSASPKMLWENILKGDDLHKRTTTQKIPGMRKKFRVPEQVYLLPLVLAHIY